MAEAAMLKIEVQTDNPQSVADQISNLLLDHFPSSEKDGSGDIRTKDNYLGLEVVKGHTEYSNPKNWPCVLISSGYMMDLSLESLQDEVDLFREVKNLLEENGYECDCYIGGVYA